MERDEFNKDEAAQQLDRWRAQIERLKSAAADSKRGEFRAEIASLQERERAVRDLIARLHPAEFRHKARMQSGVRQAWLQLRHSLLRALRHSLDISR